MAYIPSLGIVRTGAHPNWQDDKFYVPIDEDHDGSLDQDDLLHMVAEFFDVQHNRWETNLADYNPGETVRIFRDADGDNCNDSGTETQADVITLWQHANLIAFGPAAQAMNAWNSQFGSQLGSFKYNSLWFPVIVNPWRPDFGTWGPGSSKGASTWIRVVNDQTMAHELGHSVGGLKDLYNVSTLQCRTPAGKLSPWAAFINYKSVNVNNLYDVMDCSTNPDEHFFNDSNYLTLFNALKKASVQKVETQALAGEQIVLSGWIYPEQGIATATANLVDGLELTLSDPVSPYHLVLGQGQTSLLDYPFTLDSEIDPPQGYATWELPFTFFNVTAPFPMGTTWVELRNGTQVLWRQDRSASPPSVVVLEPNGSTEFSAGQEITVRWTSHDPDGDPLLHRIYYSNNDGNNWITLATGVAGTEYTWKATNSPGTQGFTGWVRVDVSDGFNQAQDENNVPFSLEGKPPQVALLSPRPDDKYLGCEPLWLDYVAIDPEGSPVTLTLSIDGLPTELPENHQLAQLSPGEHELTLQGVDDQGLVSNDQITVTFQADLDCDGMPGEYEDLYALDDGNPEDAGLDLDGDGLINLDEAWYQTNPRLWDTDGDGYSDGDEVAQGSDPLDPDSPGERKLFLPVIVH